MAGIGADLDLKSAAHPNKSLPTTIQEAMTILPPHMPPSLIIGSGNGIQVWWLFGKTGTKAAPASRGRAASAKRW